jgi:hypothetical protein
MTLLYGDAVADHEADAGVDPNRVDTVRPLRSGG